MERNSNVGVKMILVGNKCDLNKKRLVPTPRGQVSNKTPTLTWVEKDTLEIGNN